MALPFFSVFLKIRVAEQEDIFRTFRESLEHSSTEMKGRKYEYFF